MMMGDNQTCGGDHSAVYIDVELCSSLLNNMDLNCVGQMVKHLPTVWETQVRSLGWEDPLEEEMATHSRILAWEIPWTEEPGGLWFIGSQRVGHN